MLQGTSDNKHSIIASKKGDRLAVPLIKKGPKSSMDTESEQELLARAEIAFDKEKSLGVIESRRYLDSILNAGS